MAHFAWNASAFWLGGWQLCASKLTLTLGAHRGTGYIGSHTSLALLEHGYKVVIVDDLYNSSKVSLDRIELLCGKRPDFYNVDVTDEAALEKVFAAHPDIDSVIHFAALKVRRTTQGWRQNADDLHGESTDSPVPVSRRILRKAS